MSTSGCVRRRWAGWGVELPGVSLPSPTRDPSSLSQSLRVPTPSPWAWVSADDFGGRGAHTPSGCHGCSGEWHTFSGVQATPTMRPATPLLRAPPQQALRAAAQDPDWEPPRRPPAGADSDAPAREPEASGAVRGAERPRAERRAGPQRAAPAAPAPAALKDGSARERTLAGGSGRGPETEELLVCSRKCESTVGAARVLP